MELAHWIEQKREELKRLRVDPRNVAPSIRDFTNAVATQKRGLSVTVELARATPEEGPLSPQADLEALARCCDGCDVSAIAVATDGAASGGSVADLLRVSRAAGSTPILQRDLVLSREQLYQARQCQADASLLLAAALQPGELKLLVDLASATHVATPVEVRSSDELALATAAGARLVVLPAFDGARLSLALADELLPRVPKTSIVLVRGPFSAPADLAALKGRADGIWLCGPLMRAVDPEAFLRPLVQAAEE